MPVVKTEERARGYQLEFVIIKDPLPSGLLFTKE